MSDGEALLAAVEAGQAPLEVYADWCEEQGHEWAKGVRMLALSERWPIRDERGWYWRLDLEGRIRQNPHPAILPKRVWMAMYPKLAAAGRNADMREPRGDGAEHFLPPPNYPRFNALSEAIAAAAAACQRVVDSSMTIA